jgi:hypothetical protein
MEKRIFLIIPILILFIGCDKSTEPDVLDEELNDQMIFNYNGILDTIKLYAGENGYIENEIVFQGWDLKNIDNNYNNIIMLTFKLINSGKAEINDTMTGYWDLGLCTQRNKYLLTTETSNFIKVNSFNASTNIIQGEFDLSFRYEKDTAKIVRFSQGKFGVKIDTSWLFTYCIEG